MSNNNQLNLPDEISPLTKTEEEWRRVLGDFRYGVMRGKGTERAFSGAYWDHHAEGVYTCSACQLPLFSSESKFNSGTGWPSFFAPLDARCVQLKEDYSHGMYRTEVLCPRCGGHLGHMFNDGPAPSGKRYCINSISLDFVPTAYDQHKSESE